jgi:hypothetical protein
MLVCAVSCGIVMVCVALYSVVLCRVVVCYVVLCRVVLGCVVVCCVVWFCRVILCCVVNPWSLVWPFAYFYVLSRFPSSRVPFIVCAAVVRRTWASLVVCVGPESFLFPPHPDVVSHLNSPITSHLIKPPCLTIIIIIIIIIIISSSSPSPSSSSPSSSPSLPLSPSSSSPSPPS